MFGETQFSFTAGFKTPSLDTHGAQRRSTGCRVCRVNVHTGHTVTQTVRGVASHANTPVTRTNK